MHDTIIIREAVQADTDILVEYNRCMARETEGKELDPAVLTPGVKAVFENPGHGFYLVAELEGEVVGCLMITTEWSDWRNGLFWWIQSVYISAGFRRRGVFRALYEEVRERAGRSDQVCGCRLYVERENSTAQSTYARLGMTETNYKIFEELI